MTHYSKFVICIDDSTLMPGIHEGEVYLVVSRNIPNGLIKIHKGEINAWSTSRHFEPFEYPKDTTPRHQQRCIVCSTYGADLACIECARLIQSSRIVYANATPSSRAKQIEGQLAYFDNRLKIVGHRDQPTTWNVIKRMMQWQTWSV